MRRYETVYILRPTLGEDQINTVIDNTTKIIQLDKGLIIDLDKWGIKKLAYPIKKETLGYYVFCDFAGSPEAVAEFERKFRIDDSVLRYLTIKTSDAITSEEVEVATRELATRKEAAKLASETNQDNDLEHESDDDSDILED
jgi:small subunit ribosomal protein S6